MIHFQIHKYTLTKIYTKLWIHSDSQWIQLHLKKTIQADAGL